MSAALDNLKAKVTKMDDAADGAKALIVGLAQKIRDAAGDVTATNALADQLDAKAQELADAVVANTDAE